jgi:hypothetical protein
MGIEEVKIAPRSPWQNPYCERVICSIRRDALPTILCGLLSSVADTPIIGDGCTGAPSGSASSTGAGQEASRSRRFAPSL